MIYAAATTLAQILKESGPPVLKTKLVYGKRSEPRLQLEGDALHAGEHDPHKEGRACDIVLLASKPTERAEAYDLIKIFMGQASTMKWNCLIYNKVEWDSHGTQKPRLYRPKKEDETAAAYADKKAKFEHVSHIHIEWTDKDKDFVGFRDDLVQALQNDTALGALDVAGDVLHGTWDATIGTWSGVFKFTRNGAVSWADSRSAKPGGTGTWNLDTPGKLTWQFGGGDVRTFVTTLPVDVSETGDILPAGQGSFAMVKGAP